MSKPQEKPKVLMPRNVRVPGSNEAKGGSAKLERRWKAHGGKALASPFVAGSSPTGS